MSVLQGVYLETVEYLYCYERKKIQTVTQFTENSMHPFLFLEELNTFAIFQANALRTIKTTVADDCIKYHVSLQFSYLHCKQSDSLETY